LSGQLFPVLAGQAGGPDLPLAPGGRQQQPDAPDGLAIVPGQHGYAGAGKDSGQSGIGRRPAARLVTGCRRLLVPLLPGCQCLFSVLGEVTCGRVAQHPGSDDAHVVQRACGALASSGRGQQGADPVLGGQDLAVWREPPRDALAQVGAAALVAGDGAGTGSWLVEPGRAGVNTGHLPAGRAGITQQDTVGGAGEHPGQPPGQQPPAVPPSQAGRAVPGAAAAHRAGRQIAVQDRVIQAPGGQTGLVLDAAQPGAGDPGH
jgi:hypothetical protein